MTGKGATPYRPFGAPPPKGEALSGGLSLRVALDFPPEFSYNQNWRSLYNSTRDDKAKNPAPSGRTAHHGAARRRRGRGDAENSETTAYTDNKDNRDKTRRL